MVVSLVSIVKIYYTDGSIQEYEQGVITGNLLFIILGAVLFYIGNKRSKRSL